jgi:hypothetical protein
MKAQLPAWPRLGFTLATTLLLLLIPAILLRRLPRPQAIGLEKLMATVSLLQSFGANPERPVPELWRQRLGGDTAEMLWRLQTRTWWQFWDGHADGQAFLAMAARSLPASLLRSPTNPPLFVGDLAVFSPDPLSRQMLSERLRPQVRRSPGVRFRCLPRLERDQAVFWRPIALGEVFGPLATFLQDFQEGCLTLRLRPDGLLWTGEAASIEGMLLQRSGSGAREAPILAVQPLANDVLLDLQGPSLERLLAGLLARDIIRQPLAERYGLGRNQIALLRQTPFRLVLRPRDQGPFQASVDLTVLVGNRERQWKEMLNRLAGNLKTEGLRSTPTVWPNAVWQRRDGVVVGGWQRRNGPGRQDQITLFLGPPPPQEQPFPMSRVMTEGGMTLTVHPQALALRGLLPPELPEVVKRSRWLWVSSAPSPGYRQDPAVSQLQGMLLLRP